MYTDDGMRRCEVCGSAMSEGYLFPDTDEHICSEECLVKFYHGDVESMENDRNMFGTSCEVFFYTEWGTCYAD